MRITQPGSYWPPSQRGKQITVQIDGQAVTAYDGETIAAVLLAAGIRIFRHAPKTGQPRGLYCGMGICYDCLVTVNSEPNIRACLTPVTNGMLIETRSEIEL
jgi:sarcosine oxidase subunit alpha